MPSKSFRFNKKQKKWNWDWQIKIQGIKKKKRKKKSSYERNPWSGSCHYMLRWYSRVHTVVSCLSVCKCLGRFRGCTCGWWVNGRFNFLGTPKRCLLIQSQLSTCELSCLDTAITVGYWAVFHIGTGSIDEVLNVGWLTCIMCFSFI